MFSLECNRCKAEFYSSCAHYNKRYVTCPICNFKTNNPYYKKEIKNVQREFGIEEWPGYWCCDNEEWIF